MNETMLKKEKLYAVIGLGRFGFSLAKRLAEAGKDLIVIDRKETVINDAVTFTDQRLYDDRPFQGESAECGHPEL